MQILICICIYFSPYKSLQNDTGHVKKGKIYKKRKREREKERKHIITLERYITRTIHDLPHFVKYVGTFSSCIGRTVLILKVTGFCGMHCC
jgi:hypothetical protein